MEKKQQQKSVQKQRLEQMLSIDDQVQQVRAALNLFMDIVPKDSPLFLYDTAKAELGILYSQKIAVPEPYASIQKAVMEQRTDGIVDYAEIENLPELNDVDDLIDPEHFVTLYPELALLAYMLAHVASQFANYSDPNLETIVDTSIKDGLIRDSGNDFLNRAQLLVTVVAHVAQVLNYVQQVLNYVQQEKTLSKAYDSELSRPPTDENESGSEPLVVTITPKTIGRA